MGSPNDGDKFGSALVLDGLTAIVGRPGRKVAHVFGVTDGWWDETHALVSDQTDHGLSVAFSGNVAAIGAANRVGVYEWDGSEWGDPALLPGGSQFGRSVSITASRVIVGQPYLEGNAFAFVPDAGGWSLEAELPPSEPMSNSEYGDAVAVTPDWVLVGAPSDRVLGVNTGAAYMFDAHDFETPPIKLFASDGEGSDKFGAAVALSGNVALIGATSDDDNNSGAGAVYVFRFVGGEWVEYQKLLAPEPEFGAALGTEIAIDGNRAVIAASSADLVVDDVTIPSVGAAYVFADDGFEWSYVQTLLASDAREYDNFGQAVAIDGEHILIGSYGDGDYGTKTGSVYAFSPYCPADWNADGATNTLDFLAFLNDWVRRRGYCDLNRDGSVNTQDFLAYLNDWVAGC